MTGRPRAKASPCATPQAIRRPVNEPGPAPNATASSWPAPIPAAASSRSSIGSASSEWRIPARRSSAAISPSAQSATEHHSVDVSIDAKRISRFYA